jgi:hypothetical protein
MERSGAIGLNFNPMIVNPMIFNPVIFNLVVPARLFSAVNLMEWKISSGEPRAQQYEVAL